MFMIFGEWTSARRAAVPLTFALVTPRTTFTPIFSSAVRNAFAVMSAGSSTVWPFTLPRPTMSAESGGHSSL